MRTCTRCGHDRPLAQYSQRSDGRTHHWCRGCLRQAQRDARNANTTANRSRLRQWLSAQHCTVCASDQQLVLLTEAGQRSAAQRLAEGCAWTRIAPQLQSELVRCRRCIRRAVSTSLSS